MRRKPHSRVLGRHSPTRFPQGQNERTGEFWYCGRILLLEATGLRCVGHELVQDTPHMDRQPASVFIIRLIAEQIEKLALEHGDHEVKSGVRVAHNEEQGGFSVSQGVKFQVVILHQVPQFLNIEWSKPGSAANQDGLCRFASNKMSIVFNHFFPKMGKKNRAYGFLHTLHFHIVFLICQTKYIL